MATPGRPPGCRQPHASSLEANPRTWFKHCFPPGLGYKLAFLGYARPAQGGIPQCSELLARYAALLVTGERALPADYAQRALDEGRAETEVFYVTPNATSLIDFPSFTSSVARLIGCEPRTPVSPARFLKFWTLPMWTYFYRLRGPGAKPAACAQLYSKFGMFDALVPMPLLALFAIFAAWMQPLLLLDYLLSPLLDCGLPSTAVLPRFRNWRVGAHFHQLSGNRVRLQDGLLPSHGFALLWTLLLLASGGAVWLTVSDAGRSWGLSGEATMASAWASLVDSFDASPTPECHRVRGRGCVPSNAYTSSCTRSCTGRPLVP